MSNAVISSSGKGPGGTLHSLGGVSFDDYFSNLVALFEGDVDEANAVVNEFRNCLTPAAAGAQQSQQQGQPQGPASRGPAGSPPGGQTLCPTHQQPAVWKDGGYSERTQKNYNGFWKCPVSDKSISNFNGQGLKSSCPTA